MNSKSTDTGTEVLDPVCGMTVDPNDSVGPLTYKGTQYWFCGQSCYDSFAVDPEKYLSGSGGDAGDPNAIYICPMHPEIRQKGPGSCPKCGMALEPETASLGEAPDPELVDMTRRFWVSLCLTAPLILLMFAGGPAMRWLGQGAAYLEMALATPVVVWGGWPFFERFWDSLRHRSPNMFTLIGLGTGVAWIYSVAATLLPNVFPPGFHRMDGSVDRYFESSATIVTLVLLGQVLELRARRQTGAAIRALLDLAPKTARRVEGDVETDVPLVEVQAGDVLRVRFGEKVPVDGTILEGATSIDESMVTGEAIPVARGVGSPVIGATLNGNGTFLMRAERVGSETMLAHIVKLVGEAQRSRAPIQSLADKVSSYFVPSVFVAAIVTFIVWAVFGPRPAFAYAVVNSVAVVIIACPCALGLATPMAVVVAVGRGAREGILFRNAEALEELAKVDTLVVDKTGTLTEGKPSVKSVFATEGSEKELLEVAAGLEQGSSHPLASAILAFAATRAVTPGKVKDVAEEAGAGVRGILGKEAVYLGSPRFLASAGIPVDQRSSEGSLVYVAMGNRCLGHIEIVDPVKPTTEAALRELEREGLAIVMLTGDRRESAEALARQLSLRSFEAEVKPKEKLEIVERLRGEGRKVAMAGDGINDGPALAKADVGIAMGSGADVAIESAGVTLVKGDLQRIVYARSLSRAMMRNVRQNLVFAFAYNALGIPLAAGLLYPLTGTLIGPAVGAAAMSLSSVSVIGNALRLSKVRLASKGKPLGLKPV